ncbi:MAG TPA: MerR family transcriptional regulator [Rubricoccaceae bacterium]|nr:MerR family transcriptional regulator [Rubricoccaceae bacterium]
MPEGIRKLYYSISEVSARTGLKPHVLRFWETEFPDLQPRKNRAGNRIYTERDIALVERIQHLLRNEKYTLEGARKALERERVPEREDGETWREDLRRLRAFLEEMLRRLPA